jgi:hypothetical protein
VVGAACSGSGRSLQSRESGGAVGSCCPPLPLSRPLRAANPRGRACDPGRGQGAEGAQGGGGGGQRRARPLADCAPSLWSAQVVGGCHLAPSWVLPPFSRAQRSSEAGRSAFRGIVLHEDARRQRPRTTGSCCSAARTLELFSPDRRGAGSDADPNPSGTKMRPDRSLGTQLVVLRVRGPA